MGTATAFAVEGFQAIFPEDFADHIEQHRCPRHRTLPIPKLLDMTDNGAIYDEAIWRKRPDWTFEPEQA